MLHRSLNFIPSKWGITFLYIDMSSTMEGLTHQLTNLADNRFNRQLTDKSGRQQTDKNDMRLSWHVFRMERVSLVV